MLNVVAPDFDAHFTFLQTVTPSITILSMLHYFSDHYSAQRGYADCHYTESRYADGRYTD